MSCVLTDSLGYDMGFNKIMNVPVAFCCCCLLSKNYILHDTFSVQETDFNASYFH